MDDIDIIKSQMILKLKTGLSMRVKSCVTNTEELYRLYLKGYMGIPFFPLYVFPQD